MSEQARRDALAEAPFGLIEPTDEGWNDRFDPAKRDSYRALAVALLPLIDTWLTEARAEGVQRGREEVRAAVETVLNPDGHPNARDYGRAAVWADDVRAALGATEETA